jgi:hypothetical protein
LSKFTAFELFFDNEGSSLVYNGHLAVALGFTCAIGFEKPEFAFDNFS